MTRAAYALFFLAPIAWLALTSFWPEAELTRALPTHLSLEGYAQLFTQRAFSDAVLS
jgi:ABC-type glycerol-3-phosphate transport system permease component